MTARDLVADPIWAFLDEIVVADCVKAMRLLPEVSVSAVVCDPPYGLSVEPDVAEVLRHWLAGDDYEHRSSGFMGKSWDSFVPGPATWREVLRVLKPGGHALVFAGTRTQDLMGMALRIAGFEIRDTLAWIYGSGFPKSLNVSAAIDRAAGVERTEVIGQKDCGLDSGSGTTVDFSGSDGRDDDGLIPIYAPATEEAKRWDGWGTALKPAYEPVVVARKPLSGTVASTVLGHGTGALNVEGCRIGESGGPAALPDAQPNGLNAVYGDGMGGLESRALDAGRWPSNVLLDAGAASDLDCQSGESTSGRPRLDRGRGGIWSPSTGVPPGPQYGDSGGASRFFFVAKASGPEREAGLAAFQEAYVDETREVGSAGRASPRAGAGRPSPRANIHPTVKPIELMRWLVRLVTPPGGLVLDPFAGSGTTGCAAVLEGFDFIGLEREVEYAEIARARIAWWAEHPDGVAVIDGIRAERERTKKRDAGQLDLLAGL